MNFVGSAKSWTAVEPGDLFHAQVEMTVAEDKKTLVRLLQQESRQATWLYLWLDFDEDHNIDPELLFGDDSDEEGLFSFIG